MNKNLMKKTFNVAANVLLIVALAVMVIAVYLQNFYLAVGTIALSALCIVISVFAAEKMKISVILKDLNIYFFLVCIVVSVSVVIDNQLIFYVGLVLFILMILLYFIPMFVTEKEDKKNKKRK